MLSRRPNKTVRSEGKLHKFLTWEPKNSDLKLWKRLFSKQNQKISRAIPQQESEVLYRSLEAFAAPGELCRGWSARKLNERVRGKGKVNLAKVLIACDTWQRRSGWLKHAFAKLDLAMLLCTVKDPFALLLYNASPNSIV